MKHRDQVTGPAWAALRRRRAVYVARGSPGVSVLGGIASNTSAIKGDSARRGVHTAHGPATVLRLGTGGSELLLMR
jgi:hypothetical protein